MEELSTYAFINCYIPSNSLNALYTFSYWIPTAGIYFYISIFYTWDSEGSREVKVGVDPEFKPYSVWFQGFVFSSSTLKNQLIKKKKSKFDKGHFFL